MENGNRLKTIIYVVVGILGMLGIGTTIVIGYTNLGHQVADNKESADGQADELHEEIRPAIADLNIKQAQAERDREAMDEDIMGLEADIDDLGDKVDRLRTEQNTNFQKILERLPK